MMLHLRDLAILAAVVEEDGIQGAAVKLHKTPASISQTIKRLEESLSLELFDRTHYRLKLSEQGEAFLHQARLLMGRADALERYARLLAGGQERSFKISVHPIIPDAIYLPRISRVVDAFRKTSLHISMDTAGGPLLRLQNDQVDISIAVSSHAPGNYLPGTESILLGRVQTLGVIHPSIFPAITGTATLAGRLSKIRQIVVSGTVEGAFGEIAVFDEESLWFVGCPDTKRRLILQGLGWGRLPLPLIKQDLQEGRLVSLMVPGLLEPEEFSVWAFRRTNRTVGPVAEAVWRELSCATTAVAPQLSRVCEA